MENITANTQDIERAIRELLNLIGEDPEREGLIETPMRVRKMIDELFCGYKPERAPVIKTFRNDGGSHDMIIDKGEFYSLCEHHMLPFFGEYEFAYIPGDHIVGLSKIARCVRYCSSRLQVQERLARDVITMMEAALPDCLGMAIRLTGTHMCKRMRGVRAGGKMTNCVFTGVFEKNDSIKSRFMADGE